MSHTILLNFFPATFSHETVSVWMGVWTDKESAAALRERHPGLETWRDGKHLFAWHPTEPLPDKFDELSQVTVRFVENPRLFRRLADGAVRRKLAAAGFTKQGMRSFVNYGKGSLLAEIPSLANVTTNLGIYPRVVVRTWLVEENDRTPLCGLVVDVLYKTKVDISLQEWLEAGAITDPVGEDVILLSTAPEALSHPRSAGRVVGALAGIRGATAVLRDSRIEGVTELALSSVALYPTRYTLERYLSARFAREFSSARDALHARLAALVQPAKRLERIRLLKEKRLQPAGEPPLAILPGVSVTFGDLAVAGSSRLPYQTLQPPEYNFDRAGDKRAKRVDDGLKRYGPFDSHGTTSKDLTLLVVAPAELQGQVERAVQYLTEGIPTSSVFDGLRRMYRLPRLQVRSVYAAVDDNQPMAGYAAAVRRALVANSHDFAAALVVIRERYRTLPDSENPYYQTKAQLLTVAKLPTQSVTIEKLRAPESSLQYVLNTLALALYAKMGGVSHVLRAGASNPAATELVFGVGRAFTTPNRSAPTREETIGFATVFRANGEYLYNDCTPYCKGDDYEVALEETILRAVASVAAYEGVEDGAEIRLVFHVPRSPGSRERSPIINAVRKLPRYNVKFALLHVNADHQLNLFQVAPPGDSATPTLPPRGISITTGQAERLVTFVGPKQYRKQGMPVPLLLTLDGESTFTDIDYLTQQLYLFSFMSAASLNPGIKPATIAYAERLATLTGHLRGVAQWTVDLITKELTHRLWFI